MGKLFGIFFIRTLTRIIGQRCRYMYYKLIGRPKTMEALSNKVKDEYSDLGNALNQDFLNALIGTIVFVVISVMVAWLVYN